MDKNGFEAWLEQEGITYTRKYLYQATGLEEIGDRDEVGYDGGIHGLV